MNYKEVKKSKRKTNMKTKWRLNKMVKESKLLKKEDNLYEKTNHSA